MKIQVFIYRYLFLYRIILYILLLLLSKGNTVFCEEPGLDSYDTEPWMSNQTALNTLKTTTKIAFFVFLGILVLYLEYHSDKQTMSAEEFEAWWGDWRLLFDGPDID